MKKKKLSKKQIADIAHLEYAIEIVREGGVVGTLHVKRKANRTERRTGHGVIKR